MDTDSSRTRLGLALIALAVILLLVLPLLGFALFGMLDRRRRPREAHEADTGPDGRTATRRVSHGDDSRV